MGRPRKHNIDLPPYVEIHHGSYRYKSKTLCRVKDGIPMMYDALAKRLANGNLERVPAAVAAFKQKWLADLAPSTRKEHGRLLDVFSDEFQEFRVDQVTAKDIKRSARNLFPGKLSAARAYKARISTFFTWCIRDQSLRDDNPCSEVWLKKPLKRKDKSTDD